MGKVARAAWTAPCEFCGSPVFTTYALGDGPDFAEACHVTGCEGGASPDMTTWREIPYASVPLAWQPLED